MKNASEVFNHYSTVMVMFRAFWYPVRKDGGFKTATFNMLHDVKLKPGEYLKNMDKETVKSITLFNRIKKTVW